MQTPWGDVRVADAHVHFFSHRFFSLLGAQMKPAQACADVCAQLSWAAPPEAPAALARIWGAELDHHGIGNAALIASLPGDEDSVVAALEAAPGRFAGYFLVNPLAPRALENVKARLSQGLRGVVLFPAMHHYSPAGEALQPFYEAAAAVPGAVVFVHCGVLSVGVRKKLGLASHFDMRYSNPLDLHAPALRYPQLPFVIPHFGAGMFREALMLCDLCPNVHLDTSSSNSWMAYQESELTLEAVFRKALAVAGPRRLLFGTDSSYFPRGWNRAVFDRQVEALRALAVDSSVAAAILGENLRRLLRIA